jgi:hypothetical protein
VRWPWSRRPTSDDDVSKSGGAGGFTSTAPAVPPTKPAGADGVSSYGGFIVSGERNPRLQNREKWVTFDNATLNIPIISAAINIWTQLCGSAKWSVEPNKSGGADAQRAADIVTEGLIEAQLSTPWRQVVRRQVMKKFRGFALHEVVIRRRSDGMVVIADLLDRPQWTVWRWNKPDEQSAWLGVEQLTLTGETKYVERERLFYSVENTLSATPDGVGLLRQLAEPVRVLELYEQWEGIGFQTDLRGIPLARAPLAKLRAEAAAQGAKTDADIQAYIQGQAKFLVDFLLGHNKRSDQGVLLDSQTFTSKDPGQTPSAVAEWAFELIKGGGSGMPEINVAIGRRVRDIARVMNAEFLLLGDTGSGSDAMHEDKTEMFAAIANSTLDDLADDTRRDIAARLVALNGLDPETCTPTMTHEPVMRAATADACRSLMMMFQAGLNPRDPAINILRNRMDLPDAPDIDETDFLLPRGAQVERLTPDGEIVPQDATLPGVAPAKPTAAAPGRAGNVNVK